MATKTKGTPTEAHATKVSKPSIDKVQSGDIITSKSELPHSSGGTDVTGTLGTAINNSGGDPRNRAVNDALRAGEDLPPPSSMTTIEEANKIHATVLPKNPNAAPRPQDEEVTLQETTSGFAKADGAPLDEAGTPGIPPEGRDKSAPMSEAALKREKIAADSADEAEKAAKARAAKRDK